MMIKQNENEYLIKTNGMWKNITRLFRPDHISHNDKFSLLRNEIRYLRQKIHQHELYIQENKLRMQNLEGSDKQIASLIREIASNMTLWKERVDKLELLAEKLVR